jgi:hypothetical protein
MEGLGSEPMPQKHPQTSGAKVLPSQPSTGAVSTSLPAVSPAQPQPPSGPTQTPKE